MRIQMKIHVSTLWIAIALLVTGTGTAHAEGFKITTFDSNGELTFSTSTNYGSYSVQWASSPDGPWNNSWNGLKALVASGRTSITCRVPMFYRVVATPSVDAGEMVAIAGGKREIWDPDFGIYHLTVDPFFIDIYEVSGQLFNEVAAWSSTNGFSISPTFADGNIPAYSITWYDSIAWSNARSEMEGRTPCYYDIHGNIYRGGFDSVTCDFSATGYRLPTSAEWEIAARGGNLVNRFPWGDTINHSNANYAAYGSAYSYDTTTYTNMTYHPDYDNSPQPYFSPVGSFPPNGFGLYDMIGNINEWCWDKQESDRCVRGGIYSTTAESVRCGVEAWQSPITVSWTANGFRCVVTDSR